MTRTSGQGFFPGFPVGFDPGFGPGFGPVFGPGYGPGFGLGGFAGARDPFMGPPVFRFGDSMDSLFCRSITPESRYRLTIETENSTHTVNVTGQDVLDCLTEEHRRCSAAVMFNDDFLNCLSDTNNDDSDSTESSMAENETEATSLSTDAVSATTGASSIDATETFTVGTPSTAQPTAENAEGENVNVI
ncbi:uncharacterized protein LOC100899969 [Galendromus occidentalis]|uniref:Uncharacterized protein LOC100899969 n=1 Tax=Galendromus occidentalis TaxID=34638 RepID=A0AAJ6QST8_9ACAR|nr:uncharacterized protein LOC100899969 [Galendromus occidentalis]